MKTCLTIKKTENIGHACLKFFENFKNKENKENTVKTFGFQFFFS